MIPCIIRWIKQNSHKLIYIATLCLLVCAGHFACQKILSSVNQANSNSDTIAPVTYTKDVNGKLLAVIRTHEIKLLENKLLIDSLAHALKKKPIQIKAYDRYITQTDTVVKTEVRYIVSGDSVIISKKDAYLDLLVIGKDSGISYFHLQHTDTLYRTEISTSPIFKQPYTNVYLRNGSPYNKILAGNSLRIKSPRPILTIGPYVGYDPLYRNVSIGVSLQMPVLIFYRR